MLKRIMTMVIDEELAKDVEKCAKNIEKLEKKVVENASLIESNEIKIQNELNIYYLMILEKCKHYSLEVRLALRDRRNAYRTCKLDRKS